MTADGDAGTSNATQDAGSSDVTVRLDSDTYVGLIELNRPPNNFLDITLLQAICTAFEKLDADPDCRAVVLASAGRHFCAGRDFSRPRSPGDDSASIYREAGRLLSLRTPVIAAVQGGAIGAGMGLALWTDFRTCSAGAYFAPNFVQLGLHHGFGLSATLPRVIGRQRATQLLYLGDKVGANQSVEIGLVDFVSEPEELLNDTLAFAARIAAQPPLAVQSIRATLRSGLAEQFRAATERESLEQTTLATTADAKEAATALREHRPGHFQSS